MPFRDPELHLQHILASIAYIEDFLGDRDYASYVADLKTKFAVERQLQILTEAAFRLGDEAQVLCPYVDWRGVRGMGNRLRHWYDKVNDPIVWNTIQHDLPPLKIAVMAALQKLTEDPQ